MTKGMHFLLIGLAVVSFLLVGYERELPTSGAAQAGGPLGRIGDTAPGRMKHVQPPPTTPGDPIELVDPSTLTCDGLVTFDDVSGGVEAGTNYDSIFETGFAYVAERFVGQILSTSGDFDVLSGTPTGPLALQIGATNQNLSVLTYGSNVLAGLGPVGYPYFDAIGEGAFAVLFDFDQSEIGLDIVVGEGGSATVNFFKRDGALLQTIVLAGLMGDQSFGFKRAGGTNDIAGFSIHNDDPSGIGYDNLCHDVQGVPGPGVLKVDIDIKPQSCPNFLNTNSKGVLPVAVLGTEDFDVNSIDVSTVELDGVFPLGGSVEDIAAPFPGEVCDCWSEGPDGFDDLILEFDIPEIVDAIGEASSGDTVELTLEATLTDGTRSKGSDCVVIVSPFFLKDGTIAELEGLKPTGKKKLDKQIDKAIRHIQKSLEPKRWLDETHLHHKHGKKVFHEEKKAVKDIKKLCKKGEFPGELCERLMGMLVDADSILARVAIDDAIAAGGKEKEIEKAEKEMAKAEKDKQKEKYDKAIDHYKHAWQHAIKAVKKHKQRNQMIGETKGDRRTMLLQNRPNPCREFTIINYQLPEPAHTTLRVYDTSGRMLKTLVDGQMEAGHHTAHWDGRDSNGNAVPSGVYFYQIKAGDYTAAKKLLLLR